MNPDHNWFDSLSILVFISLFLFIPHTAYTQTIQKVHISGSPNPVGSGARSLGMGGAFIGVADDATAASWNPGGLIQLETPEVSCVFSYEKLYEDRSFHQNPGASGNYGISLYDINYLSMAYPFNWLGCNMIVSLNYQTLYNFNRSHNYDYNYMRSTSSVIDAPAFNITTRTDLSGPKITDYDIDGYLKALSPAFAIQITPKLSFGLTLNWFHPDLGSKWEKDYYDKLEGIQDWQVTRTLKVPPFTTTTTNTTYTLSRQFRYYDEFEFKTSLNPFGFRETSYVIGFLWNINKYFTLGGVYKPGFTADVKYKEKFQYSYHKVNVADPGDAIHETVPLGIVVDEDQEIDMPPSYGLGISCRLSDQFTVDLDVYRTDWQDFLLRQESGHEISLITGEDISLADTDPTHQVRLGAEYLFFLKHKYVVPLRAGLFYDPEPTEDEPDTFYGVTLGGGIAIESFVFDVAYQYRWGDNVRLVSLDTEEVYQDVEQHTIYASVIYHF